jgi:hypothetical protein
MAMHDHIFIADIENIERIYRIEIPYYKRGMQLKIKKNKLNLPIFRESERSKKGYRISKNKFLQFRT